MDVLELSNKVRKIIRAAHKSKTHTHPRTHPQTTNFILEEKSGSTLIDQVLL